MVIRTLDAEVAFPAQCELAEGPLWDASRGLLRWVDILPGQVHALDVTSGAHRSLGVGDTVGTVGLTRSGGLVLALAGGFALPGPDTGALYGRRRLAEVSGGVPDGLTLDAEGCLWLAVWGSSELRRYTPDGRLDTIVKLPVSQVSSAAFGGADLSTLCITTARESFTAADLAAEPHAGDIFACTPGACRSCSAASTEENLRTRTGGNRIPPARRDPYRCRRSRRNIRRA